MVLNTERTFGEVLRDLRRQTGKSMGQLAQSLDVTVPYVADVERGRRSPLAMKRILQAAAFLGIDPETLLLAAALEKKRVELSLDDNQCPHAPVVGVFLARWWPVLSENALRKIHNIVEDDINGQQERS